MHHSSNSIVRTVFNNALYNSNSCIGYTMAYFGNAYAVDITKHDPSSVAIDNLLTLLHVRSDISYIEGFDGSDIDENLLPRFDSPYFIQSFLCNLN